MKKILAVFIAIVMLLGVNASAASAGVVNPCRVVSYKKAGPVVEILAVNRRVTELLGEATLQCSRTYNRSHNRVHSVSYIEKFNPRYKKWMTFRPYARSQPWAKGARFSHMAGAAIRCDGSGIYRQKVVYWTSNTSLVGHKMPSSVGKYHSPGKRLCENTPKRRLWDVNKPQIVRLG